MEGLLTEVSSTRGNVRDEQTFILKETKFEPPNDAGSAPVIQTREDLSECDLRQADSILDALRSEPSQHTFERIVDTLRAVHGDEPLNLQLPGPTQAKIIYVLVDVSIPTFWHALATSSRHRLVQLLSNIAAINAIISKLQRIIASFKENDGNGPRIGELLAVLRQILRPYDLLVDIWQGLSTISHTMIKHNLAWKESLNTFGSGKLISVPAQAYQLLKAGDHMQSEGVLSGTAYVTWLAESLLHLAHLEASMPGSLMAASQVLSKALSLGYPQTVVTHLITRSIDGNDLLSLVSLVSYLSLSTKRRYIESMLAWMSTSFSGEVTGRNRVAAAAIVDVLQHFGNKDTMMRQQLAQILLDARTAASLSLAVQIALMNVLAHQTDFDFGTIAGRSLATFGDQLFIDHAPVAQQETIARTVILSCAHLARQDTPILSTVLRASHYMQAISNRLASSNPRARWLGMIVGMSLSRLVDKPGSQMNFGTADMDTVESQTWLGLNKLELDNGAARDLLTVLNRPPAPKPAPRKMELPMIDGKQTFGPPRPPELKQTEIEGERIAELDETKMNVGDDLVPYAKPDDDPEDSDEDATLVNRDKARPPVYIRTLMNMLRDTEKADNFQLAIKHAAPLIRRKTGFGREVTDHAEELARTLTNLQDPFETEGFDQLRLRALIAIILSDVSNIAPWLSRQAFIKDYSIAQRTIMLTALGMSGRELAGLKHEDQLNESFENTSFPSKLLPAKLHAIYGQSMMLDDAARSVEQSMIQPLALAAADQTTSHLDAVKVRKFSSRMDIARTKRRPAANALAKIFHTAFFFPLITCFQQDVAAYGDSSAYLSIPLVLTTFLKTLALLLHASGPATVYMDRVIAEFWEMLLSLRVKATSDVTIMETILFCLLTMLEMVADSMMNESNPNQLVETKEWCEMVFERTGGGHLIEGQGQEARVRMLSAAVITKTNDMISKYQKRLLGG